MNKTLVIARGLPGSGKSTACKEYVVQQDAYVWAIMSTDLFFTSIRTGKYMWSADLIDKAHEWNRLCCLASMRLDDSPLILIDNTNIKRKHYQPYIDLANKYGYTAKLLESSTPWAWDVDECFRRNVHGVPLETIKRMKEQYEPDDRFETIRLPHNG